jgi:hypothetical protein
MKIRDNLWWHPNTFLPWLLLEYVLHEVPNTRSTRERGIAKTKKAVQIKCVVLGTSLWWRLWEGDSVFAFQLHFSSIWPICRV